MTRTEAIRVLQHMVRWGIISDEKMKEALKIAINSLEVDEMYQLEKEDADEFISCKAYDQVMWERDIAIAQLKELGYGFGEEIRQADEFIPKSVIEDIKAEFRQINAVSVYKFFGYDEVIGIIDKHINGKE